MKTSLTGIKPTATPHLGNYLGAIRPALKLAESYRTIYFIADYHAMTTMRDPAALNGYVYDVAATWLACGLNPEETIFFRQSAVIEVFELAWIFSCMFGTGHLLRGHSYKDAQAKGDGDPNAGITFYPMLMAADIVLYDTHVVPVGKDQKQHLEITRDVTQRFNHHFGEDVLVMPEALIGDAPLVPGTDGDKMSKSRKQLDSALRADQETAQDDHDDQDEFRGTRRPEGSGHVHDLAAVQAGCARGR